MKEIRNSPFWSILVYPKFGKQPLYIHIYIYMWTQCTRPSLFLANTAPAICSAMPAVGNVPTSQQQSGPNFQIWVCPPVGKRSICCVSVSVFPVCVVCLLFCFLTCLFWCFSIKLVPSFLKGTKSVCEVCGSMLSFKGNVYDSMFFVSRNLTSIALWPTKVFCSHVKLGCSNAWWANIYVQ